MKKTAWMLVFALLFTTVFPGTGMLWGGLTAYAAGDGTPPVNDVGYPYVRNVGTTSLDLFLKTDEAGTAYYKICDTGTPAPGAAEVKATGVDFGLPGPEEPARAYAGKFSPGPTYHFSGVAADADGNIYTVNLWSPYDIRKYDRDGNLLGSWPSGSYPKSIEVDGDGYIYVGCYAAADNIRKFHVDSNNNLIQDAAWTVPQESGSGLIALDHSGFIYSAFYDGYDKLYKLNTTDGTYTYTSFSGDWVQGLAVDDNNNLYVALNGSGITTIRKYDQDGNLLLSDISAGRLNGTGISPQYKLAVDKSGNIYVNEKIEGAETAGYGVHIFDRDGNYRGKLDGYAADGDGRLKFVALGMTTDADGNLYLYDYTNIWQFAAGGKASITSGLEQGRSYDIYVAAEDADGNLQAAPQKLSVTMNAETAAYPVFAKGYPRTADVKNDSLDLQVKMNKTGSFYYKVLTRGTSAPTSADLKAGGTQVAAEADTVATAQITGLHNGMAYDIYVAAEDAGGNLQPAPTLVRATPSEAEFDSGYPKTENVTATGTDLILKASEPGTAYYKVYDTVPQAPPSAEDVASTGTPVEIPLSGITWGGAGSGDGQFNNPHGVAEDGNGNIYVADTGNHRIQKFDVNGNFITKWGSQGSGDGQFESPWDVAVDENDHVWVTDAANGTVQEFDANGNFLSRRGSIGTGYGTTLDEDTASNNAVEFIGPKGLTINKNGGTNTPIIAADAGNHRLQEFQRSASPQTWVNWGGPGSGGTVGGAGQQYNNPIGVAMDQDGNIYVADRDNDRIQKVAAGSGTATGSVLSMWGGYGSGEGQFLSPTDVAVDEDGSVYVTDTRNHRVQIFNSDGNFLIAYGSEGSDNLQFQAPTGIAVDAGKNIYVADAVNNRIQKIFRPQASASVSLDMTAGKSYVIYAVFREVGGNLQEAATRIDAAAPVFDTGYPKASGVTGDSLDLTVRMNEGGTVYYQVRDHGAAAPASAELKSGGTAAAADESFITKWGANGSGDGQFQRLPDVAADEAGNVYVADGYNDRIQKLDKDGNFLTKWGSYGTGDGQFSGLYGIAVDADGNVYAADSNNNRIQKFDGSGNFLGWGGKGTLTTGWHGSGSGETGVSGSGDGELNYPFAIAIDRHGDIYVTDYYNYRVQKFDSSGNFLGWFGKGSLTTGWHAPGSGETGASGSGDGQFSAVLGIAVDGEDNVYVTDFNLQRVQKFDRWGNFITKWGATGSGDGQFASDGPTGIEVDKDGNVYVTDNKNNRIQKFDGDGNFLGKFGSLGTGDGQFRRNPYGIAAANDGHLYVVTYELDYRVHKFGFAKTVSITDGLEPGHTYDIYLAAEDGGGRLQAAPTKVTVAMDEAAAIASGYPQAANVRNTSLDLLIKTNKAGTAYYKAYTEGAAAPTSAELRSAGTPATIAEKFANLWGTSGSGDSQLNMPFGITADADGNIYVADTMNNRVQKLDSSGALLGWFGKGSSTTGWHGPGSGETGVSGSGDGEFNIPFSVAADESGNVYVADMMNNRIQKFDSSGNYLAQWGSAGSGDGQFNSPVGITVDGDGNVYVTDRENKRVQKFGGSGNYLAQWGTEGTGDGQFEAPIGIVADQNGNVYVADELNNRVQKFDKNGNFLLKWGKTDCSIGSGDGEFHNPEGMAIDSDGYIYVVESGNNRVQKFDGSGSFISKWGGAGSGEGQFSNPYGIAVGSGGVYIADTANNRVQQYAFMETANVTQGLADGQAYDIYAVAESVGGILQSAPVKVTVNMDTAPVFDSGYPQAANVQNTSLDLLLKQDEAGTAYYKAYDAGMVNPSSADLKAQGTAVAIADTAEVTESITSGLTEGQSYDIFVAAENGNGSLQVTPVKVTVTMTGTASGAHIASTVPTALTEATANNGSLDPNTVVITIADGTLAADIAKADVTAAHLPAGLDYTVTRDSDTQLTVTITGQAANNTIADNVDDLTFTIANAKVTGAEGSLTTANISISFKGPAAPTNPVVNDSSDTFGWTWTTGYETAAQYEYSVDGGITWNDCTANPQPVGNHHYGAGTVRVRVKAGSAADGYAGGILVSGQAYTKVPVFDGGYPQTSNVTETTLDLTIKMDEAGTAYYKAYSHGADAPSAAEVKAGGTAATVGTAYVSQWGGSGSGNGQFNTPNMVAVDQAGNIYVADDGNARVQKFDSSGNWLAQFGSSGSGDGQFQGVNGVAVDADGNVYVTDWSLHRVQKFDGSGNFLAKWGGSGSGDGQFSYPYGVAVDAAGNVYVADSHNNRIQKFDGSGNFLSKWGSGGSGNGQFNLPVGVAVDSAGNVYVADCDNNRVQKFDGSGNFLAKWGGSGTSDGQFAKPQGIAVDQSGNVYVADFNNYRVQKFSGSGTFISNWGGSGSGDGQFNGSYGVAVDSAGNIYVSDRPNNRIENFSYINTASLTGLTGGQTYDIYVAAESSGGSLQAAPTKLEVTMAGTAASIASTVPTALTEAAANDGSLTSGTVVITIANGTLADPLVKADVTAANLPEGLDYAVTRDNDTQLTITISGNAANHANTNDVSNLTFTIAQAKVTGATGDLTTANISIDFNDPAGSDTTPPAVADGTIGTSGLTYNGVTLSWNKATDDVSTQGALQYLVYRSDSNNIDTVENIEANGTAIGIYATDINTKEITGLTAGATYYFNVIVKDEAGNKTAYAMQEVTTSAAPAPSVNARAGVTVIIHGWNIDGNEPLWTASMQNAIIQNSLGGEGQAAKITVIGSKGNLSVASDPWDVGLAESTNGQVVVRVDWSAVANNLTSGVTAQEVAAAIAPYIYQGQNGQPPLAELPIHLIGHSRGGGMVYDLANLLGEQGIEVEQLTSLDPHPLTASDPQGLDEPLGPGPTIDTPINGVPENVLFADNYWQDISYPEGQAVAGAYNREFTSLPGGYHNSGSAYSSAADHLNIVLLYQGTIDTGDTVNNGEAAMGSTERSSWFNAYEDSGAKTGFYYSGIGGGNRKSTDAPVSGGDRPIDGYHNDALLGGAGSRQALTWTNAVWPNIVTLDILRDGQPIGTGTQTVTPGEALDLKYTYRDYDGNCDITFYADQDTNPYNDNNLASITTQSHTATGSDVTQATAVWNVTSLSPAENYYVYAKINDGTYTRYIYAVPEIQESAAPAASIASTAPASLTEAAANDGSLASGTIVITIANGTLANPLVKADVTAANLPEGLDYTVTRDSDTQLTITINGNAANHANANDVSNLTFTIAQAKVTGAESNLTTANISIDFNDPAGSDTTPPTVADGTIGTSGLMETGVTLSWSKATDNESAQGALQYLVYRSDSNNIDTVENVEAHGTAIGTYATDINTKEINGLASSTTYYFNVIVKDEAGNKTAYTMKAVTTEASSLPVMGGTVAISGEAKYGETLTADISGITYTPDTSDDVPTYQWKRGGANIAGATASTYTLAEADIGQTITVTVTADGVHATGSVTSAATAAVEKADGPAAPAAPMLVSKTHNSVTLEANAAHEFRVDGGPWQDSNVFTGLSPETEYTFTARVKETATHKESAASTGLSVTTDTAPTEPDTTPPAVADGTIGTSALTDTGVTLSWSKATDNVTTQGALQYLVYRSDSNNIDTVENIEANGTAIGIYATDINTKEITGLTGDTTYYFNVIVKDEAGNKTAYTMQEVTTTTPASAVIQNVVLSPTTHEAGTAQDIQVTIFTANVADGAQTVASFVYGQGDPLVPEIIQYGTINNNTAVLTLTINGSVAAGSYKVKVEVDGIADPHLTDYIISEPGQAAFIASTLPTALSEAAANDGSLNPNTVIITIANGTLAEDIAKADVTAANLPAGLDYNVTRTDATHLTVNITGNATNHANADDVSNLRFTIAQAKVTGAESDLTTANISINFNDPAAPAVSIASTLPTSLTEAAANDGSLTSGTVVITIANGTLAADIAKADVTAANLPAGLDYTITRTDATHLTINITGNAANHANADDVSNLRFTIAQAKVTGAESDLTTANISINFNDPAGPVTYTVTIAASEHGTATGSGTYIQGQSVTLSATPNAGYNFSGWYEGATKVSSLPNYTFTAESDITLTPSFAAMEKGFLEVTTVGDGSVILNGTINCNGNYKDEHAKGTSIQLTATANAGYAFAYWEDVRTASIISTNPVYECTMGTGVNVKAVFNRIPTADTTEFTVTFKDKSGKILKSTSVVKNTAATPPANAPALAGYSFTGWDKEFTNVTSDLTVIAKYERLPDTYTVTVAGGTLSTGGTTGNYQYDMPVTVVAGTAPAGLKFSHWTQDGKKVSTQNTFSFFTPMKNTVLTAVFVDESTEIVNVPFITLSEDIQVDTANSTMLFTAIRDVPDGYTLVESGVLMLQSNTPPAGELTVDTENVIRGKIKNDSTDQFYIRKSNITAGDTWYARAYLIYRDAVGNIITVYSDNTINGTME